jgi:hypothetical protein
MAFLISLLGAPWKISLNGAAARHGHDGNLRVFDGKMMGA